MDNNLESDMNLVQCFEKLREHWLEVNGEFVSVEEAIAITEEAREKLRKEGLI